MGTSGYQQVPMVINGYQRLSTGTRSTQKTKTQSGVLPTSPMSFFLIKKKRNNSRKCWILVCEEMLYPFHIVPNCDQSAGCLLCYLISVFRLSVYPFIRLSVYLFIHFSVINAPVTFWGIIFGLSIYGWMDGCALRFMGMTPL